MTPNNIAGMGSLKGLNIMALTDHNSCGNCPAFFEACRKFGIIPIAGMELTTAEDIHLVCLFSELDAAMDFDALIKPRIMPIKNRPDIFGNQLYLDRDDQVIASEETLLISATDLECGSAVKFVREHGGICYPAHIDRTSNGMIAVLGDIPPEYGFTAVEYNDAANADGIRAKHICAKDAITVCSSDAHHLWDINEAEHSFMIEDEPYSSKLVRENLLFNLNKNIIK